MNEDKFYKVYMHTTPSGKKYIGITCQIPEKRWGKNGIKYMKNSKGALSYFGKAILKYGWDNITHEILSENLSKDEANKMERELIKEYKTTNRKYGYNISIGGEVRGKSRKTICIETNEVFDTAVEAGRKYNVTPCNINSCCQGKSKTAGGYHWEYLNYIKKELPDKVRCGKISNKKQPIKCVETDKVYDTITQASKELQISRSSIQLALWYPNKTAKGYHFIYCKNIKREVNNTKKIICKETGVIFNSSIEASKFINRDRSTIRVALREPHRTAGGYHWKYYNKEVA